MNLIWHKHLFSRSRFIKSRKIYILPTFSGIKLFCVNLLLLLVGLIYANNFVLFFDFLLFGLFVCSMFYTHFNLEQVEIISIGFTPGYAGESGEIILTIKNTGHMPKIGITFNFPQIKLWDKPLPVYFDLASYEVKQVRIPVKLKKRGLVNIQRTELKTVYPFNFFKSFSYADAPLEVVVYPARDYRHIILDVKKQYSFSNRNDEDLSLVKYENGKPLARLFWKRFAMTGELYSRTFEKVTEDTVKLYWDDIEESDLEKKLEVMSSLISYFDERSIPWEALIEGQHFLAKNSGLHLSLVKLAGLS